MDGRRIIVILLSTLLLLSTGVFINEISDFKEPSRMTILSSTGFGNFGITLDSVAGNVYWQNLVYKGLISSIPNPTESIETFWEPELADGLPEPIEQSDGSFITSLNLKPNLKFGSGNDLTVEDVIFSYKLYMTPSIEDVVYYYDWLTYYFESNNSITNEGNTINFHFKIYDSAAIWIHAFEILEKAVYQPIYDSCEEGDQANCVWTNTVDHSFFSQGAGPYKLKWYKNGTVDELLLEKNPYYWDSENVFIDEIHYKNILNIKTALSLVENSTIDLIDRIYKTNLSTYDAYSELNGKLIPTFDTQLFVLNHYHPIFGSGVDTPLGLSDPNQAYNGAKYVRKALAHLIDRNWVKNHIYSGLAEPAASLVPAGSYGWDGSLQPYPYDIEIAKSLMEQSGYDYSFLQDTDQNGLYDNFFFNLSLITPDWDERRVEWSSQLVVEGAKIGINISNSILDVDAMFDVIYSNLPNPPNISSQGGYDLFSIGLANSREWYPDHDYNNESLFPTGGNWENYVNDSLSELVLSYQIEQNPFLKAEILEDIQYHFKDEVVHIPVIYPKNNYGIHCRLDGIEDLLIKQLVTWKNLKIDYSSCPDGVVPDFFDDLINSPAIFLIFPGAISGLILIGLAVNHLIHRSVRKEIRQLPAKEKAMTKDYLEKARKIAEEGGDFEEDQYPDDYSDLD